MGLALVIIQGIGVLAPVAMDLALVIKKLFEPHNQVDIMPMLIGWNTNADEALALIAQARAAAAPTPNP